MLPSQWPRNSFLADDILDIQLQLVFIYIIKVSQPEFEFDSSLKSLISQRIYIATLLWLLSIQSVRNKTYYRMQISAFNT